MCGKSNARPPGLTKGNLRILDRQLPCKQPLTGDPSSTHQLDDVLVGARGGFARLIESVGLELVSCGTETAAYRYATAATATAASSVMSERSVPTAAGSVLGVREASSSRPDLAAAAAAAHAAAASGGTRQALRRGRCHAHRSFRPPLH